MIHCIYKSHEGQFKFYCEADIKEEGIEMSKYVLHLKPSAGDALSIDTPTEILEFVDLVKSVYAGEQCATGTVLEELGEQELEDLVELLQVLDFIDEYS